MPIRCKAATDAIRDEFLPRDPDPGGFATNIAEMYRRFANAIVEGEALEPGFDTALELHRIIEATRASATIGASVELDLLRPSRRQFAQAGNRKSLRLVEEEE